MQTVKIPLSRLYFILPSYFRIAESMLAIPMPRFLIMLFSIGISFLQGFEHTMTVLSATDRILTFISPPEPHSAQPFTAFSKRFDKTATKSISVMCVASFVSARTETEIPMLCALL